MAVRIQHWGAHCQVTALDKEQRNWFRINEYTDCGMCQIDKYDVIWLCGNLFDSTRFLRIMQNFERNFIQVNLVKRLRLA